MEREIFDQKYRKRLEKLSTTNLSDALDKIGIRGAVIGIRPVFGLPKIVGLAVTIKITAAGMTKSKHHLGIEAIASAHKGDLIVIDNHGDTQNNCWGEILTCAAKMKGVSGVIIDGAARDVDMCAQMDFPVFSRGVVPITARGRVMQEDFNCLIRLGDVQVRPGDILVGDINGVVVIPPERLDDVLSEAEKIMEKEELMKKDILSGLDILEVDKKYNYEQMLKNMD
ncbi:MAG: RraA family protein [Proteobacteria bacterium]|nr:RraA family protein [Pseudomonadota bacterium]MBU1695836.1 RraA family protein [Pseudomonadota bacterium]